MQFLLYTLHVVTFTSSWKLPSTTAFFCYVKMGRWVWMMIEKTARYSSLSERATDGQCTKLKYIDFWKFVPTQTGRLAVTKTWWFGTNTRRRFWISKGIFAYYGSQWRKIIKRNISMYVSKRYCGSPDRRGWIVCDYYLIARVLSLRRAGTLFCFVVHKRMVSQY